MSLSLIKCLILGHKIKKFRDPNYQSSSFVYISQSNPPVFTINGGQLPHWMIEYHTQWGDEYIMHPCDRCSMMISVKKVKKK